MIRIALLLLQVALVSLVSLTVGTVVKGAQLWLWAKPWKRLKRAIRQRRTSKRMASWHDEHGGYPDEIRESFNSDEPQEVHVSDQVQSVIRSVLKSAGGGLVGAGLVTSGELEVLAGAAAVIVGLVWSWYVKRRAA